MFGQRILILVPHPDDEVAACAATIGRARRAGAQVFALYLTHGCIARDVLWPWQRKNYERIVARRRAEAEKAARFLGVTPVGWSDRPARHLWRQMKAVYDEIQNAVAAHGIDQLWAPAYEGGNPDHDALNAIGQSLTAIPLPLAGRVRGGPGNNAANFNSPPSAPPASDGEALTTASGGNVKPCVLEFAEYNYSGGKARSQTFPAANGTEQTIKLAVTERAAKQEALALYKSEKSNLNYVRVERECFRPMAAYDYNQPPHPGTLWYARFQWVPFRHPRVDFTDPADVSKAIASFMKRQEA